MRSPARRHMLGLLGGVLTVTALPVRAATACLAMAGRTVRFVCPFGAGGGYDLQSRLLAPALGEALGAQVVVENVVGAGGVIGAKQIARAAPDGTTLGLVPGDGLLARGMLGEEEDDLDPAVDLAVLGRLADNLGILAVAADSPIAGIEDLYRARDGRPHLLAMTDIGGGSFVRMAVAKAVLDLEAELVAGYGGTKAARTALFRGEVDVVTARFASLVADIERGALRPLLQLSAEPLADHPSLAGVPVLLGPGGAFEARRAALGDRAPELEAAARAFIALQESGRLVVAPAQLPPDIETCLTAALDRAVEAPAFVANSRRAQQEIRWLRAEAARALVAEVRSGAPALAGVLRQVAGEIRS